MQNVQKKEVRHFLSPSKSLLNLERKIQAIQQYIKNLEKLKQMKDLEIELKANLGESFKSRYRYGNHSNSSFDYKKIKLPNIPLFDLEFSIK